MGMSGFHNDILKAHNDYRKRHAAGSLKWSSKLENNAQRWANQLAKKGYLQHENQKEEGENIAVMKGAELTGQKAADMWYDEIKNYNFNKPGFNSNTGHFTQLVWNESTEIGVGRATASNGMQFVVARYFPAGNHLRKFPENVKPPGSLPNSGNNQNGGDNRSRNSNQVSPSKPDKENKPPAGKQSDSDFRKDFLRTHNQCRKRHGSLALKWNSKLEQKAREAAEDAAQTNTLRSVDMSNVGQNMAAMSGGELTGEKVSQMWYDEEGSYNYSSPGFSSTTGSFTQLIWKESTTVGVGRAFGKNGQTFVIALYQPPGNIRGQYEDNVLCPSGPMPGEKKNQGCGCTIL